MPRRARLAALALAAALLPPAAGAEEPPTLTIPVGEKVAIHGYAGMCDDLSVATITMDADATITALKEGSTRCSSMRAGGRFVYRVVVVAPPRPGAPKDGKGARG